mmetsp:Transcript_26970/g.58931  ORF Transcript_26970/g.58931 Transcript_26970/m.58931 type:complete len:103 (-) Transcript_26970:347-655(-)
MTVVQDGESAICAEGCNNTCRDLATVMRHLPSCEGILGSDWTKWSGAWPCSWGRVRSRCPVQMPATTIEIQVLPINISQEEHLLQAEEHGRARDESPKNTSS